MVPTATAQPALPEAQPPSEEAPAANEPTTEEPSDVEVQEGAQHEGKEFKKEMPQAQSLAAETPHAKIDKLEVCLANVTKKWTKFVVATPLLTATPKGRSQTKCPKCRAVQSRNHMPRLMSSRFVLVTPPRS